MKKNNFIKGLSVLAIACTFSACQKSDLSSSASSSTQMSFAISASGTGGSLASVANSGGITTNAIGSTAVAPTGSITWTSGIANIAYFKLEAKKKNTEIEITTKNLSNVDLFAITPASISTVIDTGTYKEIEVRVALAKTSGSAIPLTLKGTFTTPGGAIVPIEYDFNEDALIKVEAENITIDGKTDIAAIAKINLTTVINGMTAAALDKATRVNGTLIISSTVNADIYDKIKANVALSGGWGGFSHHDKSERHG
ncbi:MAG TPA: hypothetical protein VL490_04585 [Mucilaginibacter sp.]|jgi:hypothetical protein|nr:hypothetical protein [Mucilaginibacter sp.]